MFWSISPLRGLEMWEVPDVDNRQRWLNEIGSTHVVTDIMYRRSLIDRANCYEVPVGSV